MRCFRDWLGSVDSGEEQVMIGMTLRPASLFAFAFFKELAAIADPILAHREQRTIAISESRKRFIGTRIWLLK
jgi:hypothetical protein